MPLILGFRFPTLAPAAALLLFAPFASGQWLNIPEPDAPRTSSGSA